MWYPFYATKEFGAREKGKLKIKTIRLIKSVDDINDIHISEHK